MRLSIGWVRLRIVSVLVSRRNRGVGLVLRMGSVVLLPWRGMRLRWRLRSKRRGCVGKTMRRVSGLA